MTTSAGDQTAFCTDCRRQRWTPATPARSEFRAGFFFFLRGPELAVVK